MNLTENYMQVLHLHEHCVAVICCHLYIEISISVASDMNKNIINATNYFFFIVKRR